MKHIRDQIAIVMQEPLLFNESIKDNIKYGCPNATNAQVLKAATQANCLDFVQSSQDQFAEPGVVRQLNEDFAALLRRLQDRQAGFSKLRECHDSDKLSTEEIYLLKDVLESLNSEGLDLVHANMDTFAVQVVQNMSE